MFPSTLINVFAGPRRVVSRRCVYGVVRTGEVCKEEGSEKVYWLVNVEQKPSCWFGGSAGRLGFVSAGSRRPQHKNTSRRNNPDGGITSSDAFNSSLHDHRQKLHHPNGE